VVRTGGQVDFALWPISFQLGSTLMAMEGTALNVIASDAERVTEKCW